MDLLNRCSDLFFAPACSTTVYSLVVTTSISMPSISVQSAELFWDGNLSSRRWSMHLRSFTTTGDGWSWVLLMVVYASWRHKLEVSSVKHKWPVKDCSLHRCAMEISFSLALEMIISTVIGCESIADLHKDIHERDFDWSSSANNDRNKHCYWLDLHSSALYDQHRPGIETKTLICKLARDGAIQFVRNLKRTIADKSMTLDGIES